MKPLFRLALLSLSVLSASTFATGCAAKHYWRIERTPAVSTVTVQPHQVLVQGSRLYVEASVINRGPTMITVVRDAITVELPDGQIVGRSTGITSTHKVYSIPPGGAHAVNVDFREAGFEWNDFGAVRINWSAAIITANNEPISVPPTLVRALN